MTNEEKLLDIETRDSLNKPFSRMDTRWLIEYIKRLQEELLIVNGRFKEDIREMMRNHPDSGLSSDREKR